MLQRIKKQFYMVLLFGTQQSTLFISRQKMTSSRKKTFLGGFQGKNKESSIFENWYVL